MACYIKTYEILNLFKYIPNYTLYDTINKSCTNIVFVGSKEKCIILSMYCATDLFFKYFILIHERFI